MPESNRQSRNCFDESDLVGNDGRRIKDSGRKRGGGESNPAYCSNICLRRFIKFQMTFYKNAFPLSYAQKRSLLYCMMTASARRIAAGRRTYTFLIAIKAAWAFRYSPTGEKRTPVLRFRAWSALLYHFMHTTTSDHSAVTGTALSSQYSSA